MAVCTTVCRFFETNLLPIVIYISGLGFLLTSLKVGNDSQVLVSACPWLLEKDTPFWVFACLSFINIFIGGVRLLDIEITREKKISFKVFYFKMVLILSTIVVSFMFIYMKFYFCVIFTLLYIIFLWQLRQEKMELTMSGEEIILV